MEKLNSTKNIYQNFILGVFALPTDSRLPVEQSYIDKNKTANFAQKGGLFYISGFYFSFQVELPIGISPDMRELTIRLAFHPAGTNHYDR
jgi:hypothetical protein